MLPIYIDRAHIVRHERIASLKYYPKPVSYKGIEIPEKNKLKILERTPQYPPGVKPPKVPKRLMDIRGPELVHNKLIHEQFGLIALVGGYLQYGHLDAIRNVINRNINLVDTFAIWRIDAPWKPITKKGVGKRMGGGKGNIHHYVTPVKAGRVIFEIGGRIEYIMIKHLLTEIEGKMPIKTKGVNQEMLEAMELEKQRIETEDLNPFPFKYVVDNNMLGCHTWISPYDRVWYGKYR